jgi:hypothetical protein
MGDVQRVTGLTDATGHLWSARHELMAAGYGSWTDALLELIDTIRLEIDWLSSEDGGPGAAR